MKKTLLFIALKNDQRGVSAIEYGLILSLIVLGIFTAISGVAEQKKKKWDYVQNETEKATASVN